jgi:hypothetical protein
MQNYPNIFTGLPAMKATLESLHKAGVNFKVFDNVRIEPTDARYKLTLPTKV